MQEIQARKNNTPQEILEVIKSSKNILIIMDSRFDFDALCCVLAFSDMLRQINIQHKCVYSYEMWFKAKEYFDTGRIEENVDLKILNYQPYDLIVCMDSGMLEHLNKTLDFTAPVNKVLINIDHHDANHLYGTYNYVVVKASTTHLLYDLFLEWKIEITPEIANYLLSGLVSDSGLLHFNTVNSETLRTVADLIDLGGKYFDFISFLTMNTELSDMIVQGILYSNLKVDTEKKFAYSVLLEEEVEKKGGVGYGIVPSDTIKTLSGVDFVFTIKKQREIPDAWNISLRSHNMNFDVLKIAQKFNGGGRPVSAGFNLSFSQAETVEDVVEQVWNAASSFN